MPPIFVSTIPSARRRRFPPVASIVQDATFAAFRRVIAAAVDSQVDFVLLAGNSFVEAEQSLAARLALLDGFAELAGNDIRVFILPGPLDPIAAWRQIPDLPENVTLLDPGQKFAAVKRDETVIARVGARLRVPERKSTREAQRKLRSESLRPSPSQLEWRSPPMTRLPSRAGRSDKTRKPPPRPKPLPPPTARHRTAPWITQPSVAASLARR